MKFTVTVCQNLRPSCFLPTIVNEVEACPGYYRRTAVHSSRFDALTFHMALYVSDIAHQIRTQSIYASSIAEHYSHYQSDALRYNIMSNHTDLNP